MNFDATVPHLVLPHDSAPQFMKNITPRGHDDEMPLSAALLCHIFLLNSVLEREGNRQLEGRDLTLPQWLALGSIGQCGQEGITHSQLGQRLMLSKAPITGVVDRLETAGFVQRQADARDRRVSRVVITPSGLQTWLRVRQELRAHAEQTCKCLSAQEQKTMLSLLGRLLESAAQRDPVIETT